MILLLLGCEPYPPPQCYEDAQVRDEFEGAFCDTWVLSEGDCEQLETWECSGTECELLGCELAVQELQRWRGCGPRFKGGRRARDRARFVDCDEERPWLPY